MAKIAINGKKLHEIQMRLKSDIESAINLLSYPEHRIKLEEKKERFILKLPPLLAIELYRSGVLPQDNKEFFLVKLQNKDLGLFQLIYLRYPNEFYDDGLVEIEMKHVKKEEIENGNK